MDPLSCVAGAASMNAVNSKTAQMEDIQGYSWLYAKEQVTVQAGTPTLPPFLLQDAGDESACERAVLLDVVSPNKSNASCRTRRDTCELNPIFNSGRAGRVQNKYPQIGFRSVAAKSEDVDCCISHPAALAHLNLLRSHKC